MFSCNTVTSLQLCRIIFELMFVMCILSIIFVVFCHFFPNINEMKSFAWSPRGVFNKPCFLQRKPRGSSINWIAVKILVPSSRKVLDKKRNIGANKGDYTPRALMDVAPAGGDRPRSNGALRGIRQGTTGPWHIYARPGSS